MQFEQTAIQKHTLASALMQLSEAVTVIVQQDQIVQEEFCSINDKKQHLRLECCNLTAHLERVFEHLRCQIFRISETPRLIEENKRLNGEAHARMLEKEKSLDRQNQQNELLSDLRNRIDSQLHEYEYNVAQFKGIEQSQNREIEGLTLEVEELSRQIKDLPNHLKTELNSIREHYERQMAAIGKSAPAQMAGSDTAAIRKKLMLLTKDNQTLQEEIQTLQTQLAASRAERAAPKPAPAAAPEKPQKTRKLFSSRKNKIS